MIKAQNQYVVFDEVQTLVQAIHHCLAANRQFPASVAETTTGGFAVPLGELHGFERLAKQFDWKHRIVHGLVSSRSIPLPNLITSGEWQYRDPHEHMLQREAGKREESSVTRYSPHRLLDYLLGARDTQDAARLLRVLTDLLAQNIRATPLKLNGQSAFSFFWLLSSDEPPMLALQAASRAWWGPIGNGEMRVYKQWPYDLEVADTVLHQVPWGTAVGVVLLSLDDPQVLTLTHDAKHTPHRELIEVAELKPGKISAARVDPTPASNQFHIDLKLLPNPARWRFSERVNELERQIKAKQLLLERMREDELVENVRPDPLPQPLFIYYPEPDHPRDLPDPLRRLLIEWAGQGAAGQSADLDSLRYVKLDAKSLPPGLKCDFNEAHLLTTATGLGESVGKSAEMVGLQLFDYQPQSGGLIWFELMPEWADYGLSIFAPHDRRLGLYPHFRPSPYAAEKLGRALLGEAANQAAEYVLLLAPTPENRLSACRLRKDQFQAFARSIDWECALDVAHFPLTAVETRIRDQNTKICTTVENSFVKAVRETGDKLLAQRKRELRNKFTRQAQILKEQFDRLVVALEKRKEDEISQLNRRRRDVELLHREVEEVDPILDQLDSTVQELGVAEKDLNKALQSPMTRAEEVQRVVSRHRDLVVRLKTVEAKLAKTQAALKHWRE